MIVFYKKGKNSFLLEGLNSERLFLSEYTDENFNEYNYEDELDSSEDEENNNEFKL